jgi:hypothetical protein
MNAGVNAVLAFVAILSLVSRRMKNGCPMIIRFLLWRFFSTLHEVGSLMAVAVYHCYFCEV